MEKQAEMKKLLFAFLLFAAPAWGQTRFYLQNPATPAFVISNYPIANLTAWSDTLVVGAEPGHSTMTTVPQVTAMSATPNELDAGTTDSCLTAIFISQPIAAQTISGTVKGQIRAQEDASTDNATVALALVVVSNNCDTLRGVLLETSASDNTGATPPEMVVTPTTATNRQFQDGAENTSLTLSSVTTYAGDRIAAYLGFRETRNSSTATATLVFGDDGAADLAEDNTDTDADNPWFEFSQTITSEEGTGPAQAPTPCGVINGDTLFPIATGAANAWINGAGAAQSTNWNLVDENPGATGCSGGTDTVSTSSTTGATDWYRLGTRDGSNTRWGKRASSGGSSARIVDCIVVTACIKKNVSSGTGTFRLGLRDTSGNACWSAPRAISSPANTYSTMVAYFPDTLMGAIWGSTRWDSLSMAGLQVGIFGFVSSAASSRACVLNDIYVLVYSKDRDTTICDSTNLDMQTLACTTSTALALNRVSGAYMSSQNKNRLWFGCLGGTTNNSWMLTSSNDTGRTWYWLSTTSDGANTDDFGANLPDTVTIDATAQGLGSSPIPGLFLFGDSAVNPGGGHTDSFRVASYRTTALDTPTIYLTKQRQQILSELTARKDIPPRPSSGILAPVWPVLFSLADTLWWFGNAATTTNKLKWFRSIDRGQTVYDSGSVPGPGIAFNAIPDTSTVSNFTATGTFRRVIVVPWAKGYPALVTYGWTVSGAGNKIMFHRWHPAVTDTANTRKYVWLSNAGGAAIDTVTLSNAAVSTAEIAAVSVYNTSAGADTMAHVAWWSSPRILHVNYRASDGTKTIDTVVELLTTSPSPNLSMATREMDDVYVLWNYFKTTTSADTGWVFYNRLCSGSDNKWDGARPLSFLQGTQVQMTQLTTSPYQWGNTVVGLFQNSSRSGGFTSTRANRIIRMGNYAVVGGAAPTPLRRRRLIIEKNYKTGEVDEKDSLPDWAGLRLPDWDADTK